MHRRRSENYASWRGGGIFWPPPTISAPGRYTASGKGIDVVYLMVPTVLHFKPLSIIGRKKCIFRDLLGVIRNRDGMKESSLATKHTFRYLFILLGTLAGYFLCAFIFVCMFIRTYLLSSFLADPWTGTSPKSLKILLDPGSGVLG